jgi:threonyl-tRNA synthetase
MLVAGDREVQGGTVSIRGRSGANLGSKTVAEAMDLLRAETARVRQDV